MLTTNSLQVTWYSIPYFTSRYGGANNRRVGSSSSK